MTTNDQYKRIKKPGESTMQLNGDMKFRRGKDNAENLSRDFNRSKSILDTVFANIHFLIAYMDRDFNILQVNNAYAHEGGNEPEFFIGKNHFDLYPNNENERIFREVLETGKPYHAFEKAFIYPNRTEKGITYWDWSALPIKGNSNRVDGIILCLVDVTDRKEARTALQEVQETFRIVTENMEDVFWMRKPGTGEILYMNPACEKVWGVNRQILYQNPSLLMDLIHPDDRKIIGDRINNGDGGKWSLEYRIVLPDGTIRWIHDRGFPLHDKEGQLKLIAGIATDETKRKSMEEKIRQYVEELEQSNKELENFASISSHDLQEPLRKIQAFGGRLADKYAGTLGEEGLDYLASMNRAAIRMRRLIDDLLTYSRITTKNRQFRKISISEIIDTALSNLENLIEKTGGLVNIDEISMDIEADPTEMLQLFQNLVGNSLKFHRPGIPPVVNIRTQLIPAPRIHPKGRPPSPKTCLIVVEDNGIGFDEKYLSRIFEPFQRLHGRFKYEGTGMGLAICQKIVEHHGGNITAKSKPGKGTIFSVTLPFLKEKNR